MREYAGAWACIVALRSKLHSARAQAVITRIFFDNEELTALGFAKQLDDTRGQPPDYLLALLKRNCAKPLQETYYSLNRSINHEKASIEKVIGMQLQCLAGIWTLLASLIIGFSNSMMPKAMGDDFSVTTLLSAFAAIVAFAAVSVGLVKGVRFYASRRA